MRGTLQWKNNKIVMRINVRTKGGIGSAHVLKESEGNSGKKERERKEIVRTCGLLRIFFGPVSFVHHVHRVRSMLQHN